MRRVIEGPSIEGGSKKLKIVDFGRAALDQKVHERLVRLPERIDLAHSKSANPLPITCHLIN